MAKEDLIIRIEANAKGFQAALKKTTAQSEQFQKSLATTAKVSGAAFIGLSAAIAGTIFAAAKMESVQVQFEVLTGSVSRAKKAMQELQEFSAATPFQFGDIAKSAQQLLGFGFGAEELTERLKEIGDVAAASGKSIQEVALIFGQVEAAGKLTGERLLQFQERAIPIGPAIAKTMGIGINSVKEFVSAGKVSADIFQEAFASISAEGGKAFGGMAKQSKTAIGLISTLKDNIILLAAGIGKKFLPAFKLATGGLIDFIKQITKRPELVKLIVTIIASGAAITGLVTVLALGTLAWLKFRAAMIAVRLSVGLVKLSILGLIGATGIGLIIIAVNAFVQDWERNWFKVQKIAETVGNNIARFSAGISFIMFGAYKKGVEMIKGAFVDGFDDIDVALDEFDKNRKEKRVAEDVARVSEEQERTETLLRAQTTRAELLAENKQILVDQEILTQDELNAELADKDIKAQLKKTEELKKGLKTDLEIRDAARKKRIAAVNSERSKTLEDERKHGVVVAALKGIQGSQQFQAAKRLSGRLSELQESENAKLKQIGKVAAIASIVIRTAEGALAAFVDAQLLLGPILGPPVGLAAAAAIVAFGSEKISKVSSAQAGGIVGFSGSVGQGRDRIPSVLEPGELVVPTKNFEETISAVASAREGAGNFFDSSEDGASGPVSVMVEFIGDASEFLTAKQNEDSAIGISEAI